MLAIRKHPLKFDKKNSNEKNVDFNQSLADPG